MFADCRFEDKEAERYNGLLEQVQVYLRSRTLERYPDAHLLCDTTTETARLEQTSQKISRYFIIYRVVIGNVVSLQKNLPKLRSKKILSNSSMRSSACRSMERLISELPLVTNAFPVYRLQSQLLRYNSEAEALMASLRESAIGKKRMATLQSLTRKIEAMDEILEKISTALNEHTGPSDAEFSVASRLYDSTNSVAISLIDVNRSVDLLCAVQRSLAKHSDISDTEVRAISNLLSVLYSALSIVTTLSVEQENNAVEAAFKMLTDITEGRANAEATESSESIETFNRLHDQLEHLLAETIKASKHNERILK